jgi:hypothetical protein
MAKTSNRIDVYLERGKKRVFAGALDWPGWQRSGKDEGQALQALYEYGPRYAQILKLARLGFQSPDDVTGLHIVERLDGDTTTDFGAPGKAPAYDARPVDDAWLKRVQAVLQSCWKAFDSAIQAAEGKELRKGPRGGGRELEGILGHVVGAQGGYLNSIGGKFKHDESADQRQEMERARQAVQEALAAAVRGELPEVSPRGKVYWSPRYFARRSAWHILDHVWEIEDRIL